MVRHREQLLDMCVEVVNDSECEAEFKSHCEELLPLLMKGKQKYVLFDNEDDVPEDNQP